MATHDWSRFELRIPVMAKPEEIFMAWNTTAGLESWFLRKCIFTGPDGVLLTPHEPLSINVQYEWLWHGWPDDVVEKGVILDENGRNYLKFSFGKGGNVSVNIREERGTAMVVLEQTDIPVDAPSIQLYHLGCLKGWLFYLTNLKSILEGGIDLRNKDMALKDVINS